MSEELEKIIEEKDKFLLSVENVIGFTSTVGFLSSVFDVASCELSKAVSAVFIVSGTTILITGMYFALHIGRTRYMKCEECNRYS